MICCSCAYSVRTTTDETVYHLKNRSDLTPPLPDLNKARKWKKKQKEKKVKEAKAFRRRDKVKLNFEFQHLQQQL